MAWHQVVSKLFVGTFIVSAIGLYGLADDEPLQKVETEVDIVAKKAKTGLSEKKSKSASKAQAFPRYSRPDSFWRKKLTQGQYYVARKKGTEPAFSGAYWNHHDDGVLACQSDHLT